MKLNIATLGLLAVALVLLVTHTAGLPWTAQRIAGIAITLPCFVLLVIARLQLGRAFSLEAKATTLVTTGIYARIRNPIYVFGTLGLIGVILWLGKPVLFLLLLLLIPMQILRSRREAQVLTERFGQAYLDYKRKVWF